MTVRTRSTLSGAWFINYGNDYCCYQRWGNPVSIIRGGKINVCRLFHHSVRDIWEVEIQQIRLTH